MSIINAVDRTPLPPNPLISLNNLEFPAVYAQSGVQSFWTDIDPIGCLVFVAAVVIVTAVVALLAAVASISAKVNKLGSSID